MEVGSVPQLPLLLLAKHITVSISSLELDFFPCEVPITALYQRALWISQPANSHILGTACQYSASPELQPPRHRLAVFEAASLPPPPATPALFKVYGLKPLLCTGPKEQTSAGLWEWPCPSPCSVASQKKDSHQAAGNARSALVMACLSS